MADRVRFQPQERLDLVDANALQELVYEYVGQALGGIMGNAGGALTTIEYESVENGGTYYIALKPFQYYWSQPELVTPTVTKNGTTAYVPKRYRGMVVSFDPSDEGQLETVDWTAIRNAWKNTAVLGDNTAGFGREVHGGTSPGGTLLMPILWARPYHVDTDLDARREWNVAAQQELPISMKTRTRVRSEFKLQMARPVPDPGDQNQNQWVAIGRVAAWNYDSGTTNANGAYVPDHFYLAPIYCWDSHFENGDVKSQGGALGYEYPSSPDGWGVGAFVGEDGAKAAPLPSPGVKPAIVGDTNTIFEQAPFENDGATASVLARGNWLPGTEAQTGSDGVNLKPRVDGTDASWPYPGSHYMRWDPTAGVSAITGVAHGGWAPVGWLGLHEERLFPETYSLWRMGVPQLLHIMRRQLSLIMDSQALDTYDPDTGASVATEGRPWYAAPSDTGGLAQHAAQFARLSQELEQEQISSVHHTRFESGDTNTEALRGVYVAAAGKVLGADPGSAAFEGFGLSKVGSGDTATQGYVDYQLQGSGKRILSVSVTPIPHTGVETEGAVSTNPNELMTWYWVHQMSDTRFRVYGAAFDVAQAQSYPWVEASLDMRFYVQVIAEEAS